MSDKKKKEIESEMMDWEAYCSNADNGFGGDITTGGRLPTLAEWVNRK